MPGELEEIYLYAEIGDWSILITRGVNRMRVVLAVSNPRVRSALRLLLDQDSGMQVVGEATVAEDLVQLTAACWPDLLLVDWEMLGGRASEYLSDARAPCPELLVIALSDEPQTCRAAIGAGADACVYKGGPPERLLGALSNCYRKKRYVNV